MIFIATFIAFVGNLFLMMWIGYGGLHSPVVAVTVYFAAFICWQSIALSKTTPEAREASLNAILLPWACVYLITMPQSVKNSINAVAINGCMAALWVLSIPCEYLAQRISRNDGGQQFEYKLAIGKAVRKIILMTLISVATYLTMLFLERKFGISLN